MASNETCSGELDAISSVVLIILNSISGILAIGGNTLVLIAIRKTPALRTVSNYFIASLAVADLSVGAILNPLWIARSSLNIWKNSHYLAVITEFMSIQTLVTTTYGLALISFDRYMAITAVFQYLQTMTGRRCIIAISCVWVFSFCFAALRFSISNPAMLPYLWITTSIVCYTIPFSLIVYCYYHIFREARRQKMQIESIENRDYNSDSARTVRSNRKAASTIGIIIGVYLLFALPSMVIAAIQLITNDNCLKLRILKIWFWGALVSFSSSACNPWVYAARIAEFRQAFKNIWLYIKHSGQSEQVHRNATGRQH